MSKDTRTKELLEEIKRHTGLSLSIEKDENEGDQTVKVLERILEPYRRQERASDFWTACLRGELSSEAMEIGRSRYHLKETTMAVVFLVYFPQGYDETILMILRDLSNEEDKLLELDETHVVLLGLLNRTLSQEKLHEKAGMLADTLSADAMVPLSVSYDECVDSLLSLAGSYANAKLAESIGRTFHSSEHVYAYHRLGLGKLISKLTQEDCREYLDDHLGAFRFESLDAEMSTTIHAFFESGLSIANTARVLFIHRNTLVYRLDKFEKISGLDLRNFEDAVTARLGMMMEAYLGSDRW